MAARMSKPAENDRAPLLGGRALSLASAGSIASIARCRIEQLLQRFRLQRLQYVPIETGRLRALPLIVLSPAGERYEQGRARPVLALQALRDLVAIESGH